MSKKYQLDREKFIRFYEQKIITRARRQVITDLILGSEYVLTAEDILNSMSYVDGCLVGTIGQIKASDCTLIYNHKER